MNKSKKTITISKKKNPSEKTLKKPIEKNPIMISTINEKNQEVFIDPEKTVTARLSCASNCHLTIKDIADKQEDGKIKTLLKKIKTLTIDKIFN